MKDEEMAEEYRKSLKQRLIDEDNFERLEMFDENVEEAFLAGLKVGRPQWHKLDWEKDFPEADKLIRVRLRDGMERICETCYYEPTEDEIGYGKLVISFYELNGEWVDDNDVIAWCELPTFDKE